MTPPRYGIGPRQLVGRARWLGRRAEPGLARAMRRAERAAGRARLVVDLALRRGRWDDVFVLVSGDGLTLSPAQRHHIRRAGKVEVLVLDFGLDAALATSRARSEFGRGASVHRFWRVPSHGRGGPGPARPASMPHQVPGEGARWLPGRFRDDGLPATAVDVHDGRTTILHYGPAGTVIKREEFDAEGRLVRIADIDPVSGRDATHRYLDAAGACWLSVWVEIETGALGRTLRFRPKPREFTSLADALADWAGNHMTRTMRPAVLAIGETAEEVANLLPGSPTRVS